MNMNDMTIRPLLPGDWQAVRAIYEEGIATGHATFETASPSWEEWDAKHVEECRLVAEVAGYVVGWAALWPASDRCVYGGVAEVSVYLGSEARGRGLGTRLLTALVAASEAKGYWTLQAGIFPENGSSLRVHEKCGFRTIGYREKLGKMRGTWRDVVLMERRSATVGVD